MKYRASNGLEAKPILGKDGMSVGVKLVTLPHGAISIDPTHTVTRKREETLNVSPVGQNWTVSGFITRDDGKRMTSRQMEIYLKPLMDAAPKRMDDLRKDAATNSCEDSSNTIESAWAYHLIKGSEGAFKITPGVSSAEHGFYEYEWRIAKEVYPPWITSHPMIKVLDKALETLGSISRQSGPGSDVSEMVGNCVKALLRAMWPEESDRMEVGHGWVVYRAKGVLQGAKEALWREAHCKAETPQSRLGGADFRDSSPPPKDDAELTASATMLVMDLERSLQLPSRDDRKTLDELDRRGVAFYRAESLGRSLVFAVTDNTNRCESMEDAALKNILEDAGMYEIARATAKALIQGHSIRIRKSRCNGLESEMS